MYIREGEKVPKNYFLMYILEMPAKYVGRAFKRKAMGRRVRKLYKKPVPRKMGTLLKAVRSVVLAKCETKNTHQIVENTDLYHNLETITTNLLYTRQGMGDGNTGTSSYAMRIGDEVVARGLQFKMWFATKSDRPNVMFKVIWFKYYTQSTPPTSVFKSQGLSNRMIRDLDNEKLKIIKVKQFNIQLGYSNYIDVAEQSIGGKEGHKYLKCYIPLKNARIKYIADDSGTPRNYDYGFAVVPYDSYGTLTTDIVASFAYNVKFYFKDP